MDTPGLRVEDVFKQVRALQLIDTDYAEAMSKWITAKSDWRVTGHAVDLLRFSTGSYRSCKSCLEIFNAKIDMYRCPVALVPADVVAPFSG